MQTFSLLLYCPELHDGVEEVGDGSHILKPFLLWTLSDSHLISSFSSTSTLLGPVVPQYFVVPTVKKSKRQSESSVTNTSTLNITDFRALIVHV